MSKLGQKFVEFLKAEDGPTALEYAMMLALFILVCILYLTAMTAMGTSANKPHGYVNGIGPNPAGSSQK